MRETATLGGGCFWCLEAVFQRLDGVERVVSGYAGGHQANPTYREVCGGRTGHAEVVQVTFDPAVLSYRELLELFFAFHDPTTPDRQGPDLGPQYRSVVLAHDEAQARTAREVIAALEADDAFGAPVVTEVVPLERFWPAEPGHQRYYDRNPAQPYCSVMIAPKLAKLRAKYAERLRPAPA
jgi:peptide-methionine (S)-S-oxide reductase